MTPKNNQLIQLLKKAQRLKPPLKMVPKLSQRKQRRRKPKRLVREMLQARKRRRTKMAPKKLREKAKKDHQQSPLENQKSRRESKTIPWSLSS